MQSQLKNHMMTTSRIMLIHMAIVRLLALTRMESMLMTPTPMTPTLMTPMDTTIMHTMLMLMTIMITTKKKDTPMRTKICMESSYIPLLTPWAL